jgi:transcriptional regulator with XRE-family HTH domain
MDRSLGERLRHQREQQGVALRAIADQTKIKLSLLEALERDDVSQWPSGIFRRSYFRVYAQAIGLDPDAAVREFLERHPDPNGDAPTHEDLRPGIAEGSRPPIRLRYLINSAVGVLPALRSQSGSPFDRDGGSSPPAAPMPFRAGGVNEARARTHENASIGPAENRALDHAVDVDFTAVAHLCSRLARVTNARELSPVAEDAAAILHAVGIILWIWDPRARTLGPALAHGYSDELLRQLPRLTLDSDTPIASAFSGGETLVVHGTDAATGAVVVPVLPPSGCAGVLAIELPSGAEQREDVRAAATILAAQLAMLVGSPALAQAVNA